MFFSPINEPELIWKLSDKRLLTDVGEASSDRAEQLEEYLSLKIKGCVMITKCVCLTFLFFAICGLI
jgi:hypothetical protein